jgi:hypothetical protein
MNDVIIREAVRTAVIGVLVLSLGLTGSAAVRQTGSVPQETVEAFVERVRTSLQSGDRPAYLSAFPSEARAAEEARLAAYFDEFGMTRVAVRPAGVWRDGEATARTYFQAFFENDYAALVEAWTLSLERRGSAWTVARLEIPGNTTRLFKISLPAENAIRARRVEVAHEDIRFTFDDAAVFYDNIPDLDTALVVVGRGRVTFNPSDRNEKHQLDLIYKKDRIEDQVESLYIRCSPGFFSSNLRIEAMEGTAEVTPAERDTAAAVFARNYPRSFTIESSLDGRLLSFIPQSEEVGLEFKARKVGEMAYIFSPFSDDEINLYDRGKDRIVCLYSPASGPEPAAKKMFISFEEKFDVRTYSLDLSYSPASSNLSARARIEVAPRVDLLETIKFYLNPDFEILKITDALDRELFYTQDRIRKSLYIHFVEPPANGELTAIEVSYRGQMRPVPPTTDVIAQSGTDSIFRIQPRFMTYFYSHAGYWYPSPGEGDYFLARLTLAIPPGYGCVANGEMVSLTRREGVDEDATTGRAGSSVFTFVSRTPLKYLSFIVGKFLPPKSRPGPVPLTAHVSSEVMDSRPDLLEQAADILDFYGRAFGPFPYEKLGIVLRPWPFQGGHSPASFILINELPGFGRADFPTPVDTPVDLSNWDEYFLAHEIAHQWWGQGVSFESYKDQWLSEGLSQFAAASYLRHKYGEPAYASILKKFTRWTAKKSFRGPILMGSRLSYFDLMAYQAIVYDKAALVLFMLQDLLGRETFESGLKDFFEKQKYGSARTGEFIKAMESVSGRDLRPFFHGWFATWELPHVRTTWTETAVPEGVRIDFRVTQTGGPFVFPLWIETRRDGESRRTMVVVDEPVERFSVTLPRKPGRIVVNPDRAVPGKFD